MRITYRSSFVLSIYVSKHISYHYRYAHTESLVFFLLVRSMSQQHAKPTTTIVRFVQLSMDYFLLTVCPWIFPITGCHSGGGRGNYVSFLHGYIVFVWALSNGTVGCKCKAHNMPRWPIPSCQFDVCAPRINMCVCIWIHIMLRAHCVFFAELSIRIHTTFNHSDEIVSV